MEEAVDFAAGGSPPPGPTFTWPLSITKRTATGSPAVFLADAVGGAHAGMQFAAGDE